MERANLYAVVLSAALIVSGPPAADDEPDKPTADLALEWLGPPECSEREQVIERLATLAPALSVAERDRGAVVTVDARVEVEADSRWSVHLSITGPHGSEARSFVADSCEVVVYAAALVVAVTIDPVAVSVEVGRSVSPPELEPEPEPTAAPRPNQQPRSEPTPPFDDLRSETESTLVFDLDDPEEPDRLPTRVRAALGVLGGGGYGPILAPSAMVALRLAVFGERWRWSLRGGWLPPISAALREADHDQTRRARVDGVMVTMSGCGLLHAGPVEFPLCGGLEGGAIRARALAGVQNASFATQPYFGLELGPGAIWTPVPRVGIGVEVMALVPLLSGGFALDGQSVLGNFPVGVRALAGVEIRLP